MAYSTSNPPFLVAARDDGSPGSIWSYVSEDNPKTILGSGYISNAINLGMRVGDVVICSESDNVYAPFVTALGSISSGAGTLKGDVGGGNYLATGAGSGIAGIAERYHNSVYRQGGLVYTRIFVDLTGLRSTASGDIIGDDGTSNPCHLGQIIAEESGTIIAGTVTCLEVPTGGDPDIDLFAADVATGTEDTAISGLTGQAALTNGGDHTLGGVDVLTAFPTDEQYLYLVAGATTDADYTAGKLLIELIGA